MSGYAVEHDIAEPSSNEGSQDSNNGRTRRPDLSTFYATLNEANPDPEHGQHRPGAVPMPSDVRNVFYALIDALNAMRDDVGITEESEDEALLTRMIDELVVDGETPPRSVQGVSDEFCDMLERVPTSSLTPDQVCPICSAPFLDDPHPLVVLLPCHPTHLFDLACVRPWLRVQGTCPLDRTDFAQQQRDREAEQERIAAEDSEEEWDGMYS